jgi:uncharacterized membrane protein
LLAAITIGGPMLVWAVTTVLLLMLMIGASVLAALGGLWVVRRLVSIETLERNNPVADPMYQIVAVLYAVLLAFTWR